jgi:hypothetical protein
VTLFVQRLKSETKSRSQLGEAQKDLSTLNDIPILFYLQADHKKNRTRTHLFSFCNYSKTTIIKFYRDTKRCHFRKLIFFKFYPHSFNFPFAPSEIPPTLFVPRNGQNVDRFGPSLCKRAETKVLL